MRNNNKSNANEYTNFHFTENGRIGIHDAGTLKINRVRLTDAGTYICEASNSEGSQQLEVHVNVIVPLVIHIQPTIQIVDLGKSTDLVIEKLA